MKNLIMTEMTVLNILEVKPDVPYEYIFTWLNKCIDKMMITGKAMSVLH